MDESSGLENRRGESLRGFESHPLRQFATAPNSLGYTLPELASLFAFYAFLVVFTEQENVVRAPRVPGKNMYVFTGSVIEHNGTFHMFYTEYAPQSIEEEKPKNQVVHHAVSTDLNNWHANEQFALEAGEGYAKDTWRAPFVFLKPETSEFNMLLAARRSPKANWSSSQMTR